MTKIKEAGEVGPSTGAVIVGSLRATKCRFSATYGTRGDISRDDSVVRRITIHEIPDVAETSRLLAEIPVTLRFDTGRWFFDA